MFSNCGASLLMMGMTSLPPFTARVPPSRKQFCTSTTISADLALGLTLPAARALAAKPRPPSRPRAAPDCRRLRRCCRWLMVDSRLDGRTSNAQVVATHLVVGSQLRHRGLVADLALFQHIGAVRHQLGEVHVLLRQEDAHALRLELDDHLRHLLD